MYLFMPLLPQWQNAWQKNFSDKKVILAHGLRTFSLLRWEDYACSCGISRQWLTHVEAVKTGQTFEGPFVVTKQVSVLKDLPAPQAVSPTTCWRHLWWNHSTLPPSLQFCNHLQLKKHLHGVPECGLSTVLKIPWFSERCLWKWRKSFCLSSFLSSHWKIPFWYWNFVLKFVLYWNLHVGNVYS